MELNYLFIMADKFYAATQKFAKIPSAGMVFFCPEDQTVFLTHRSSKMSHPNTWGLPGGRPEKEDDSPLGTAVREVYEEIGTVPKGKVPVNQHTILTKNHHYIVFIYHFSKQEKKQLNQKLRLSDENDNFKWFDINQLPSNTHFDLSWIPNEC